MYYLDTSSFLKLYIREKGSDYVFDLVSNQGAALPVWELQETEVLNAFQFKVFIKQMTPEGAAYQTQLFRSRKERGHYYCPTLDRAALAATTCRLTEHTAKIGTRSLDIMHVACAVQLQPEAFVSFDRGQRALAEKEGLKVLPEAI